MLRAVAHLVAVKNDDKLTSPFETLLVMVIDQSTELPQIKPYNIEDRKTVCFLVLMFSPRD